MKLVTAKKAIAALREEVRGNEEYRYIPPGGTEGFPRRCVYAYNGEPSCLIGKVLVRLGASVDQLQQLDGLLFASADTLYDEHASDIGIAVDENAAQIFSAAQSRQDAGYRWDEALARAESRYKDLSKLERVAA
jgi:hypothetical protein